VDGVLVLACDMPLVEVETLERLRDGLADHPAAVATGEGARARSFEPLCAAYRTLLLDEVTALLDDGVRAAGALFERTGGVRVPCPAEQLLNVNTAADLDRATVALAGRDA
jgi:molybdopterin-guanine dinucleotide biosynthesis protein A